MKLIAFNEILKGEKLTLKATKPDVKFATIYFNLVEKNRFHLRKWLSWEKEIKTIEDALKYFFEKEEKTKNKEVIEYGIYLKGEFIGNISIFNISLEHQSGEIGYWITSDMAGNGIVTEAVKIIEKEVFSNWQFNRIQLTCDPENIASIKVAEKCGFSLEGLKRKDFFSPYFNQFRDTLIFSKLKE